MKIPWDKLTEKEKRQLGDYVRRVLNRERQAVEQTKTELEVTKNAKKPSSKSNSIKCPSVNR